ESLTISHDKAYQKAYARSEKLRASKRAWEQSEKGRAWRIAYEQSEKGKAARKAYRLSIKRNAYLADKRKVSQAIRSAGSIAYKSAIKKGFSLISRTQRRVIGNRNQNSFHGGFPLY
ncbi:hypothetical protein, partial [Endozoicomonas sp. YOMI1]|uniref:hypothetical protein n=1 Tax=Endozoicomonas sp. YOMI1 TaxID=2828739 RepID=UPI002148EF81